MCYPPRCAKGTSPPLVEGSISGAPAVSGIGACLAFVDTFYLLDSGRLLFDFAGAPQHRPPFFRFFLCRHESGSGHAALRISPHIVSIVPDTSVFFTSSPRRRNGERFALDIHWTSACSFFLAPLVTSVALGSGPLAPPFLFTPRFPL